MVDPLDDPLTPTILGIAERAIRGVIPGADRVIGPAHLVYAALTLMEGEAPAGTGGPLPLVEAALSEVRQGIEQGSLGYEATEPMQGTVELVHGDRTYRVSEVAFDVLRAVRPQPDRPAARTTAELVRAALERSRAHQWWPGAVEQALEAVLTRFVPARPAGAESATPELDAMLTAGPAFHAAGGGATLPGVLTVVADLDATPAMAVVELMAALDMLHRAWGGGGLTLTGNHVGATATSEVPA